MKIFKEALLIVGTMWIIYLAFWGAMMSYNGLHSERIVYSPNGEIWLVLRPYFSHWYHKHYGGWEHVLHGDLLVRVEPREY